MLFHAYKRGQSGVLDLALTLPSTMSAMQPTADSFDFHARAREKQASREQDERDLRSGRKSAEQLCRENELLGSLARTARVDIASSRFPE